MHAKKNLPLKASPNPLSQFWEKGRSYSATALSPKPHRRKRTVLGSLRRRALKGGFGKLHIKPLTTNLLSLLLFDHESALAAAL
jgi:hypothetical protein